MEAAMREGRHFKHIESRKHTLGDLVDRYIDQVLPKKPDSHDKQKSQLEWWKGKIGAHLLSDVSPALLAECRDELLNEITVRGTKRSPSTVVRYLAVLSHAFSIAVREWGWIEDSPMRKVTKPKEPKGRVRYLLDDERARLLIACKSSKNPYLYAVVVLALSSGMRHGEILNLKWSNIDLDKGKIVLFEAKNDETRVIPLKGLALELMKKLSADQSHGIFSYVFLSQKGQKIQKPADIRNAWEEVLKEAGIEDFRFHDLRHSAASYLAMNGATQVEIAAILGHKTLQMVKRYAHLSEAHNDQVIESMNNKIFGVVP
jgi:integrase